MLTKKKFVADRFATFGYSAWLEEQIALGQIETVTRSTPDFWSGMNRDAYCGCSWLGAGRGQVDELKETQAAVLRMKYNLTTLKDELGRLGKDYRKVLPQRERELIEEEARGISPEPKDDMLNALSGEPQQRSPRGSNQSASANIEDEDL
jgi:capsid protein